MSEPAATTVTDRPARVGLVFGGRSVEHEVSVKSARTIAKALSSAGHEVVPLGIAQDGCWVDPEVGRRALAGETNRIGAVGGRIAGSLGPLLEARVDVVFPIVHGTWGEDGCLQGLCEMLDLPYVGTGVTSSALAMDKALCKRQLEARRIPVVAGQTVREDQWQADRGAVLARLESLEPPLFVKPAIGGSSVGVTKVKARAELEKAIDHALEFDDRLLVEKGIEGRELECAVLGYENLEASEIGEIVPGKDFYDYADKYLQDTARLIAPAELDDELREHLRRVAVEAVAAIGGWGMARVDFLLDRDGTAYVNEINTLPGFTSISMYPRLWDLSGTPLPRLVDRLVDIARRRHRDRARLDRGIKEWIAELAARG